MEMRSLINKLIDRFISYASCDDNIRAVFMFGSYTRKNNPADKYSDADIIIIADIPEYFLTIDDWIKKIGEYHISFIENSIKGEKARRVLFDNADNIDFLIISKVNVENVFTGNNAILFFERGYKALIDKDELERYISKGLDDFHMYEYVTEAEFINSVNDFWFHSVWAVKKLFRGEIWAAKYCVDTYMKSILLKFLESHAHVKYGAEYDTWFNGRFIDMWGDKRALIELEDAFAHYNKEDIIRALSVTMILFHRIAVETAEKLCFIYPYNAEKSAAEWIKKIME